MEEPANTNKDSRGRRKSSPSASLYYSRRICNIKDPEGLFENDINRLAVRLCKAKMSGSASRRIVLRERLAAKCMRFFFIVGDNVSIRDDLAIHDGEYAQIDDLFLEALTNTIDKYDASKGIFTHMLRRAYRNARDARAYAAAREDTVYGGSDQGAPISLDAQVRKDDDDAASVGDFVSVDDGSMGETYADVCWTEGSEAETADTITVPEKDVEPEGPDVAEVFGNEDEAVDEAVTLKLIALISDFMGKSGRAANDKRKLYTRMFFSETLTRVTKLRTEGELAPLTRQEKGLFGAVELPFQDTYTTERCRTIIRLWMVEFVDGVQPVRRTMIGKDNSVEDTFNYSWTLPGIVYVNYLKSLGMAASDQLVSQQREHYEELLSALRAKS